MNYTAEVKNLPHCIVYYKQGTVPSLADMPEFMSAFVLQAAEECRAANPALRCVEPDLLLHGVSGGMHGEEFHHRIRTGC